MKTPLCDLLDIEYPIIQGAMARITDGKFAAAVSNAGALGIIRCGFSTPENMREEIRICKSLTDKPFGVNIILVNRNADKIADVIIEEGVPVCTLSAGNPAPFVTKLSEAGVKVFVLVPHARAAAKMEKLGAAGVICEGLEGGGIIGAMTTLPLVAQVVEAVDIPVVAAGGFATGRNILGALAMGCVGVQMGTAFLATEECCVSDAYKQMIVDAKDNATTTIAKPREGTERCLKNAFTEGYKELAKIGADSERLAEYCGDYVTRAIQGDTETGGFSCGMIAPVIKEVKPVAKLVADLMTEADEAYEKMKRIYG